MNPKKFLVVRLDHAGDIVLTVPPAVQHLRRVFPNSTLDVLTTAVGESLLRDDPNIDRIVVFDPPWAVPPPGMRHTPKLEAARRMTDLARKTLRQIGGYDVVLHLSFSPWDRLTAKGLGKSLVGFKGPYVGWRHELAARSLNGFVEFNPSEHIVNNCMRLVESVSGSHDPSISASLYLADSARAWAARTVEAVAGSGRPVALLHPGHPESMKSWPFARFTSLAERLYRSGFEVVMAMSRSELEATRKLPQPRVPVHNLVTESLREFAALVTTASVVVANDGGPSHIAAMLGGRVVSIFGPTSEKIYGPIGPHVRVVRSSHPEAPCRTPWSKKPCSCTKLECLSSLEDAVVHDAVLSLR